MTTALLTPMDLDLAVKVGKRTYRKQILPKTTINYKGQRINFDDAYIKDLAEAFASGAYDQVPVQFAGDANDHNENPRNFGGEVKAMEATPTGLDAIIELTEEADAAITKNPKLGVSARIREGLEKSDGRKFGRVVRHVLLTLDPRTSTGPWQAVDLSAEDDAEVVDLTATTYKEGTVAPTVDKNKQTITTEDGKVLDLANLSDSEFQALLDLSATAVEDEVDESQTGEGTEPKDGEVYEKDGKQYVRLDGKVFLLSETAPAADATPSTPAAPATGEGSTDLANEVIDKEARSEVQQMQIDLANDRFQTERGKYLAGGVPKSLIDLAEPLLKTPRPVTIDLSNTDGNESVNATEIVRNMLDQFKGFVDLGYEVGHSVDLSDEDKDHVSTEDAMMAAWDEEFGKV
jgi:hypothetical protein